MNTIRVLFCVVITGSTSLASNLVVNGSFEQGTAGWHAQDVEVLENYWQNAAGIASVDLTATLPGSIWQYIPAVSGHWYKLRFAMSGNCGHFIGPPRPYTLIKTMTFNWGAVSDIVSFDVTGHTFADMGWEYHEYVTQASTSSMLLFFAPADSYLDYGPALDDVSVTEIPEPATLAAVVAAGLVLTRRQRSKAANEM